MCILCWTTKQTVIETSQIVSVLRSFAGISINFKVKTKKLFLVTCTPPLTSPFPRLVRFILDSAVGHLLWNFFRNKADISSYGLQLYNDIITLLRSGVRVILTSSMNTQAFNVDKAKSICNMSNSFSSQVYSWNFNKLQSKDE